MCPGLRSVTAAMAPASRQEQQPSSYLLELAADDDLLGFRRAVQEDNLSLVASSSWYGPSPKANTLGLHLRTPAMVAALYGSTQVLSYVLSIAPSEVARASATDGATPLQLAAAGRAPSALAAARILLAAGASPSPSTLLPLDNHHHRPTSPTRQQPGSPERKKKDYSSSSTNAPAAPTEDINSGVFCTDEFRMYSFKVNPCSRAYTHDWTECPFAHPGENARRRDPRRHAYTCVPCPDFRKDPAACRKGDACEYAHGVFESWLHPAQYRTRLCKDEVGCPRRICFFAHGTRQLRAVNPSAASMSSSDSGTCFSSSSSPGAGFSSSPPASSRRPALTASLSSRDLDFDVDQYTSNRRMMMARATSPPGYSSDLVAAYAQALSSLQQQQQQARNNKPPMTLNSRAAAFANRSQTFVHRSPAPAPAPAPSPAARSFASPSSVLDNWGSPDGKLDWGVQVQAAELRKSTSFGISTSARPHASVRRDQDMYSWLNEGGGDVLAAARWSDLEQMVA
ncbi:hypothetical protein ACQ4PT_007433 [Festuca glaucescens]